MTATARRGIKEQGIPFNLEWTLRARARDAEMDRREMAVALLDKEKELDKAERRAINLSRRVDQLLSEKLKNRNTRQLRLVGAI